MKILYIDVNNISSNPTGEVIKLSNSIFNDVTYYGPGYVDKKTLKNGIKSFVKSKEFDICFFGTYSGIISPVSNEDELMFYKKYIYNVNSLKEIKEFMNDIYSFPSSIKSKIKIVNLISLDSYATSNAFIDRLKELDCFIVAPGQQFSVKLENLPDYVKKEKHYIKKIKTGNINNNWYNFTLSHKSKIVSLTHAVGVDEFSYYPILDRKYDIWIPGVEYVLRSEAKKSLSEVDFKSPSKFYNKIFALLNKIGINVYSSFIGIKIYNFIFREKLFSTRFIYTSRGGFGIPLRKFFEIPASGGLLFATPCYGFKELGFKDNSEYIQCEPTELLEKVKYFQNNIDEAQKIANNAQKLVWKSHSTFARAKQLNDALESIIAGTFNGSFWDDGKFKIIKKDK